MEGEDDEDSGKVRQEVKLEENDELAEEEEEVCCDEFHGICRQLRPGNPIWLF